MIEQVGIIKFEVDNITKKHSRQSEWKKVAMVLFTGDICEYYAWFLKKRYNIILNKPLRGPHISFISESFRDINLGGGTDEDKNFIWNSLKEKWDGKEVTVKLSIEPRTNGSHWWLNIPTEHREELHSIRNELILEFKKPYAGLHLSLGYVSEKNIEHSQYIRKLEYLNWIRNK